MQRISANGRIEEYNLLPEKIQHCYYSGDVGRTRERENIEITTMPDATGIDARVFGNLSMHFKM